MQHASTATTAFGDQSIGFTISIGATTHRVGEDLIALAARADAALYRARRERCNRVVAE
jgi:PleD family two-component response regulator